MDPADEYRSPGFQEHADVKPSEEYRAPAYRDLKNKYRDEKPLFSIICAACGEEALVPFLPEEKENPLCQACYKATRKDALEETDTEESALEQLIESAEERFAPVATTENERQNSEIDANRSENTFERQNNE